MDQDNLTAKADVRVEPMQNGIPRGNGTAVGHDRPPDGGVRAWLVVIASFLCNGIIFGVINSVGVIYKEVQDRLKEAGVEDNAAKASLVGSLAFGNTFFLSCAAGILTDQFGIRKTALLGALLAWGGTLASSFFCHSVGALYFTFGIMFGAGASLTYTPSLVILGHYFDKYLGVVNGLVTSGSSVFTLVMPFILKAMIVNTGLSGCFLFLTGLMSVMIGCAIVFKPIKTTLLQKKQKIRIINFELFRKPKYMVWTIAMAISLLGYFVPYVHTVNYVNDNYPEGTDGNFLISSIALMSLCSRLVCGKLADMPWMDVVILQQVSFGLLGILTMLMVYSINWTLLIVIALGMGICDGCSISLLGPIAFKLCGKEGASQAIGFLLFLCSIPMTVGPYLAGVMYDHSGSYTWSYVMSGFLTVAGALIMFPIHCLRKDAVADLRITSVDAVESEAMRPLYPIIDTRSLSNNETLEVKMTNWVENDEKLT